MRAFDGLPGEATMSDTPMRGSAKACQACAHQDRLPGPSPLKSAASAPMHESEGLPLSTSRQKTCREQQSDHSMPLNGTISECIYATAEYREGYYFGTKAARMHRLEAVPFPSKDPRHAGWSSTARLTASVPPAALRAACQESLLT